MQRHIAAGSMLMFWLDVDAFFLEAITSWMDEKLHIVDKLLMTADAILYH